MGSHCASSFGTVPKLDTHALVGDEENKRHVKMFITSSAGVKVKPKIL